MNTTANLLVILLFLSAFYTSLGLICGIVEKARGLVARPHQRRRARRTPPRRIPKRGLATLSKAKRTRKLLGVGTGEEAAG